MSATLQSPRPASLNRRRRVRQKVHAPAYATFGGLSKSLMIELYEVLDISEIGVAVQCPAAIEPNQDVDLCLDLAEASVQIRTAARVVWSNASGRVGLGFSPLRGADLQLLRQWLFLNAMAGAANAVSAGEFPAQETARRRDYTDTLTAASAVQREAESLGSDLDAILKLVAHRSRSLLHASAAAIALKETDPDAMTCRASVGESAPPEGASLRIGSGFSGDCVRSGRTLICLDTETDPRVDPQICRALGIRSMLASPIRSGEKIVGLIEIFSPGAGAFREKDGAVLQRFAETIQSALDRAAKKNSAPPPSRPFSPPPGSVLFAQAPIESKNQKDSEASDSSGALGDQPGDRDKDGHRDKDNDKAAIHLPRTHLYSLILAAAAIALALGFILAPWIQEKIRARSKNSETTVLASTQPPPESSATLSSISLDSANFEQLLLLARQGNPQAENALGLLYAQGDDRQSIQQNETEAADWFTKAAEHGNVAAQYKLGLLYWGGHGVPKDSNKAYFWIVLARAGGQEGSKDLAKVLANGMPRAQSAAIEQQAEIWYQQHQSALKPPAGK